MEDQDLNLEVEGAANEPTIQTETPDPVEGGEGEAPAYEPNFRYRMDDKDYEIDERLRPLVTSKENEDFIRDLVTKAHGLDISKARAAERDKKFQERESEFSRLHGEHESLKTEIQKLGSLKDQHFGTFQRRWQIDDRTILQRAADILATHDNPEAKARADQAIEQHLALLQYEDRVNHDSRNQQSMNQQLHELKMQTAMANPEIQRFQQECDGRLGTGSFMQEVGRLGTLAFLNKQYLEPQLAIAQAIDNLKKFVGQSQAAAPASVQPSPTTNRTPAAPLPNLGSGKAGTAVKKRPTSVAELRKLAQSFQN